MAVMTKRRRDDIAGFFDYVAGQSTLLRDGSAELISVRSRHDFLDQITDLRDKLQQASELIEETIKVRA